MLLVFFGIINPWMKKHHVKMGRISRWPVFDVIGGLIDLLRF
ncbi:MAG TPA: hypothetical protein VGD40_05715 [Chryseosolibacter sp.]